MELVIMIILIVAVILLCKIAFGGETLILSSNSNDWIILLSHKTKSDGDINKASWDTEEPLLIEFIPVFGWKYKEGSLTPIIAPRYKLGELLAHSQTDGKAEYENMAYFIRDGIAFNVDDNLLSYDIWDHIKGYKIEIRGDVPDIYRPKILELEQYLKDLEEVSSIIKKIKENNKEDKT
jgi:hypothetical protein